MKIRNHLFFGGLILSLFLSTNLFGQNKKAELEKERKENLRKIEELNSIISETKEKKDVSLGKLNVLKRKVVLKQKEINTLNKKNSILKDESYRLQLERNALERRLERLKHGYSIMLYEAHKSSSMYNKIAFLFLSHSFSDFMKRADFLRQFSDNRKKHAAKIEETQSDLDRKKGEISEKQVELSGVIKETKKENIGLQNLRNSQAAVFKSLSKQENQLRAEVNKRREANRRLDAMIEKIVRDEIAKSIQRSNAEAKKTTSEVAKSAAGTNAKPGATKTEKPAPVEQGREYIMNPEEAKVAKDFAALKGRMPFPVRKGFVSDSYGVHPHPVLKGVMLNNNGIDIQTSSNAEVYSVFKGIVQSVVSIPGVSMVVAIQHGDYFTVYSKLKSVKVSKGDKVNTGQAIGIADNQEDGSGEINFQVWKNTQHQNPESWLR